VADPTTVNPQITDAVTQTNVSTVGQAPAVALGQLLQSTSHALSLLLLNASHAQQQTAITAQAATTASVQALLGLGEGGHPHLEIERDFEDPGPRGPGANYEEVEVHFEPEAQEADDAEEIAVNDSDSKPGKKPAKRPSKKSRSKS
jgi:hypothetical protein